MTQRAREHWGRVAAEWAAWARRPGHDAYWQYRDAFFEEIVPPPGRLTLEVGCGEGRVARDLVARGHRVVGLDVVPALAGLAKKADPSSMFGVGDGAALPFPAETFDVVVAFNSLMDIDDMPAAVREMGRVMRAEGRLCISVTHPISDAGRFQSREGHAPFVIAGDYLSDGWFEATAERDGLRMTFAGWTHSLEGYCRALEEGGFLIERVREPGIPEQYVVAEPAERRWRRIPAFLHLTAVKL